jgi:hypothetical protein
MTDGPEFPAPPPARLDVVLTGAQVTEFRQRGFTHVDRITTDEELEWLEPIYEYLFESRRGAWTGHFDLQQPFGTEGQHYVPQVIAPEMRVPQLLETNIVRNARAIASQLLEAAPDELKPWSHMIYKPPRIGGELPWHQDEAYWDEKFSYKALGTWVPLDVATVESGCMHFLPGSHVRPIASHRHIDDDPLVQGLFAEDVDATEQVAVPLQPGGATFHHCRTMHHTPPNVSAHPRRAWATEFQLEPVPLPDDEVPAKPWLEEQRAAVAARSSQPQRANPA